MKSKTEYFILFALMNVLLSPNSYAVKLNLKIDPIKIDQDQENGLEINELETEEKPDLGPKDWAKEMDRVTGKIWVDIYPSESFALKEALNDLKEAIDSYSKIEKMDPKLVSLRIKVLDKIRKLSQSHMKTEAAIPNETTVNNDPEVQAKLKFISMVAENKADYLREILKIKGQTRKMMFRAQKKGIPLRAIDSKYFDRELLEHLDPALRGKAALQPYFNKWHKLATQGTEVPDFFFWLEGQKLPLDSDLKSKDEAEASTATRVVSFDKNGKAQSKFYMTRPKGTYREDFLEAVTRDDSDPIRYGAFNDPLEPHEITGRIHYAMDEHGTLFIRVRSPYHSYVLRGKNVISAGFIKFKDGKIAHLDNRSGHYAPPDSRLDLAKKILVDKYGENIFVDGFSLDYREKSKLPTGAPSK